MAWLGFSTVRDGVLTASSFSVRRTEAFLPTQGTSAEGYTYRDIAFFVLPF